MLDSKLKKQICDFVYQKPRVVDEIAKSIGKNWRTADRYIQRIAEEDGCISTRTFREGTRGALKIVYWSNVENIHSSSFQERLFRQIESGKNKWDFDFFDIYQYIDEKDKSAFIEKIDDRFRSIHQNLVPLLRSTENELFIFSGNMSWIRTTEDDRLLLDILQELAERNVKIRVVCRVDFASLNTLDAVYDINNKLGKEVIEVRHSKQPLRGFIIDDRIARFKDEKQLKLYKTGELDVDTRLIMEIHEKEWVAWLIKVFYHLFRNSMDGRKRMEQLIAFKK
ncbi:MAG: hypothetical protein KJ574_04295 [Nanoarchaeota archaeon]|nr:hypothetical protein [Nanoarchaeota archaeon]